MISDTHPSQLVSARVDAPARLHLGFLDPDASLGRRFASLGLVIDGMNTELALTESEHDEIVLPAGMSGEVGERLSRYLAVLRRQTGFAEALRVTLYRAPAAHAGFGSGTQLALVVGRAFACRYGVALSSRELAAMLGRGERSGIGIAAFERGGLLLDGGPGPGGKLAPLLAQADFPKAWRILLVLDDSTDGLHGSAERLAIDGLQPFPRAMAADLCHHVLMRLLPAVAEGDFEPFANSLSLVQRHIGEYFASAQGGGMYTSPAVARVLEWIRPRYRAGIGQSSWGPTGFAVLPSVAVAAEVMAAACAAGAVAPSLRLLVVGGCNRGALLSADTRPAGQ